MNVRFRVVLAAAAVVAVAVTASGCSSSGGGGTTSPSASAPVSSSPAAPAKELKVTWTYTGPEKDGGYNEINEVAMNAMATVPGVTVQPIYDVPYSDAASQLLKQAIASGTNVIVDTVGLGKLLTDVCKQYIGQVTCYSGADAEAQPSNSVSWWLPDWYLGYVAGVAAGSMTKTHTVGMVVPYKIPIAVQAINTFALGCQSVDPACQLKVVFTNSYFDPAAATTASETLAAAGADVLRNITDDPSFCKVADSKGIYAVGEYNDFAAQCPKSIITSTVWDFSNYMMAQAVANQDGTFAGGGPTTFVNLSDAPGDPHLGTFGSFVPQDVQDKVKAAYASILAGTNPLVGPISDQKGVVKVPAGTALDSTFLLTKWDWYVKGVTTSGG